MRLIKVLLLTLLVLPPRAWAQTVEYIHTDALGTPIAVTNANREVIERSEYEPYGKLLNRPLTDGPGFTGHVQDAATGMTYMQERYYDDDLGRFLSVDPVTAYGGDMRHFNRYAYVYNNPYKFTDPDGRQSREFNFENQRLGIEPPPRHPDDWLGPAIGVALGGMLLAVPDPTDVAIGVAFGRLASGLSASRGFTQAKRYIESAADGLGSTGGRSGRRTAEFEGQGGEAGASKLFNRLTRGESAPRDGGRLGSLGDGSRVQTSTRTMRDGTKETSVRITSDRTGSRIKMYSKSASRRSWSEHNVRR